MSQHDLTGNRSEGEILRCKTRVYVCRVAVSALQATAVRLLAAWTRPAWSAAINKIPFIEGNLKFMSIVMATVFMRTSAAPVPRVPPLWLAIKCRLALVMKAVSYYDGGLSDLTLSVLCTRYLT
jgi:hypothetical protein